ncbi:c-type cytochrome [Glacieibacterium frigidum]|uniref:C-type cytochrome n=1 Tax=Glacieibacterium frigidum TaxID=2593303 RepID=A0A552UGB1_9SPHN|nr:c-type cytochrome [Glacieibacterium frigidum]TRW17229.1 c-type cytochrome [Glacieibacterium frigidum]
MVQEPRGRGRFGWVLPVAVAGVVVAAGAAAVAASGWLDLSATTPDPPLFSTVVHAVFERSTKVQSAGVKVPGDLNDPSRIAIGAGHFANVCANCHGAPGFGQSPSALAMSPRPPWLPAQVRGMSDRHLFWVIKHGVKFTAMPGWPAQGRDDEIWSMVAFVRTLPRQTQASFRQLTVGDAEAAALPAIAFGPPSPLRPYASRNSSAPPQTSSFTTPVWGPADFARDGNPLSTCARCHGVAGTGRPEGGFPNLTGQTAAQLRRALTQFADGTRRSAIMQSVAAQLSPAQIDGVARYYAGLTPAVARAAPTSPAPAVDASSCNGCHGLVAGNALVYPQLRGQDARYLANQLRLFRDGARGDAAVPGNMARIAHNMPDPQIAAYARHFAGLAPVDPNTVPNRLPEDER